MDEEKIDALENKYRKAIVKAKEMMELSQTPGAYLGYKSQGELVALFLFDLNTLRERPRPINELLPSDKAGDP